MRKIKNQFVPGQGFSLEDWNEVSDNPEWTAEDFAKARPFAEVFPELAASIAKNGVIMQGSKKISVRLSGAVVETYRSSGPGWQVRIDADLRRLNKIK